MKHKLEVYEQKRRFEETGKVGTGFDAARLKSFAGELRSCERNNSPFAAVPAAERRALVHWVRPDLVAEVRCKTWTSAGVVRQASFVGLRADKPAKDIVREGQSAPVQAAKREREKKVDK